MRLSPLSVARRVAHTLFIKEATGSSEELASPRPHAKPYHAVLYAYDTHYTSSPKDCLYRVARERIRPHAVLPCLSPHTWPHVYMLKQCAIQSQLRLVLLDRVLAEAPSHAFLLPSCSPLVSLAAEAGSGSPASSTFPLLRLGEQLA
ncbi:hypothetical protein VOLCADRAFT_88036 [Volvox carteri f. nagariensis]|uniref:Uncharacterized protein n=1 Tax=Volvox carteri f. nagariensis TaxID=3068 RepID=D8TMW8_VOLCA|nr:uncharacterized protein VOLCADRAFT_88036 [Volvox carteri f. nagariensis]EFJ51324.1 hypothetical protein VOLCADRAFT_88036 [Volvox carteri f. nagariensis]|eukprot:XP_002947791.1 hypothetical protein VOLCADRAFT_88036 [Volvox carteri f. nagariensis]